MTQSHRLADGGIVDRSRPLRFVYDGAPYEGYAGDTVASALLANGIHLVARSFKYHRPRGIHTAGVEEPSALLQIGEGARSEPNVRATVQPLYDGLVAASQNRWPSLRFDVGAVNDAASRLIPAGFYYKTFMWPATPKAWMRYEHVIRSAAGMGRAASAPDPDHYEHQYAHCDVLVVGAGPAGLAAARAAAHAGARVIVCDENAVVRREPSRRGRARRRSARGSVDRRDDDSARRARGGHAAAAHHGIRLLRRQSRRTVRARRRVAGATFRRSAPRERLWKVRAKAVVLAAGAHERAIAYANNDLPGTLLAGAARRYVERYAVRPGCACGGFHQQRQRVRRGAGTCARGRRRRLDRRCAAGCGNPRRAAAQSEGSRHAHRRGRRDCARARPADTCARSTSSRFPAARRGASSAISSACRAAGTPPSISFRRRGAGCATTPRSRRSSPTARRCRSRRRARQTVASTLPPHSPTDTQPAALQPRRRASPPAVRLPPPSAASIASGALQPIWSVAPRRKGDKCFVDLQNDVTVADIALAAREGYRSVEHLKRYTTLGMGTDQGKLANIVGIALLAEEVGQPIPQVGTTTFRPPYSPVTLGAFPGHAAGPDIEPTRYSAMHDWHAEHGARFVNAGLWKRPHSYPRAGESADDAANREAKNVRTNVGVVDVSTLGKIELQGRDVAEFPESRLHQSLGHARRRPLPLRRDAARRRDGARRRHDVAARRRRTI